MNELYESFLKEYNRQRIQQLEAHVENLRKEVEKMELDGKKLPRYLKCSEYPQTVHCCDTVNADILGIKL